MINFLKSLGDPKTITAAGGVVSTIVCLYVIMEIFGMFQGVSQETNKVLRDNVAALQANTEVVRNFSNLLGEVKPRLKAEVQEKISQR